MEANQFSPTPNLKRSWGFVPYRLQPSPGLDPWAPTGISERKVQHLPWECWEVSERGSLFHAAAWFPMGRGSGTHFLADSQGSNEKQKRNYRKHREKINWEKEQGKAQREERKKVTLNSCTWNSCWSPSRNRFYTLGSSGGTTRQIWEFFQLFGYPRSNALNCKGRKTPPPSKSRNSRELSHDFYWFLISENRRKNK